MTSTSTATTPGFTQEAFEAFLAARQEPAWLTEQRREAWDHFQAMPWPGRGDEEWMRTDIRLFKLDRYTPPGEAPGTTADLPPALLAEGVDLAGRTASLASANLLTEFAPELAEQGVIYGGLDALLAEQGDAIQPWLFRAFNQQFDRFAALHAAFFAGGAFLYVPRNVVIEKPFHSLSAMGGGQVDFSHTLIVLDEGAEATFLNETASTDDADALHCGATEVIVAPRARMRYVSLQNWNQKTWHFAHQKATVDRDATLQWTVGALGSKLAKVNQHVDLVGEGAECQVNGTMFTEGKQHLSYHTLQHHVAPSCRSDFLYKAALQDHSRTVWRGMIKVDPEAQKTDGYQRNDNLLLSTKARADAIPGLEIEADDVRCTHGATTGRVDEELIFYAQCRGFTRKEAVRLIVTGFFQKVFDRITIDSVREALGQAIARRVRDYD